MVKGWGEGGGEWGIVFHSFLFGCCLFVYLFFLFLYSASDKEVWLILCIKVTAGLWVQRSSGHNTA